MILLPPAHDAARMTMPPWALALFLGTVAMICVRRFWFLFGDSHGRSHRVFGGCLLVWLTVGSVTTREQSESLSFRIVYDIVLGSLGIATTLSAARDFPHRYVSNQDVSGTLSPLAMVTQSEMMEHCFYQILNIWQALYLHNGNYDNPYYHINPAAALFLVTAIWWLRPLFPVNSFSQNWKKQHTQTWLEQNLYKIKKVQYLFYKHVILHGLNITVYLDKVSLGGRRSFRLFWICLNTAYVMEFFLQSLVRRKVLSQRSMLLLNMYLMCVSSVAACSVLSIVNVKVCAVSLLLNLFHRGHDVLNTLLIAGVYKLLRDCYLP